MLTINSHFNPFRLKLKDRKPVQLSVELINRGDRVMMITLDLALARSLSFDKSGIVTSKTERLERMVPNERKQFYFDIYPKAVVAGGGEQQVVLKVMEHYRDWKFVEKTYTKNMSILVEE